MVAWIYDRSELRTLCYWSVKDRILRPLETKARSNSVYNYRSLPALLGEAIIQPLEGCFMKISAQWLCSAGRIVVILLSLARPACADSYTIYDLGDDNSHGIYGIDAAGDVVIWATSGCESSSYCYVTYVNGVVSTDGGIPPILDYDDGTSCSSTPAGFYASKAVCNGNWIGFGDYYYPNGGTAGVYLGSGTNLNLVHGGSADQIFLNSVGDLVWVDGRDDEIFELVENPAPVFESLDFSVQPDVVRETTPEPRSLLLVGSGLLAFLAAVRRKATRPPTSYIE